MKKEILIAIGITILFLGTFITPSVAIDNVNKTSIPTSSGNTLYVGGSGEGNYTKIQDAIDDAYDGDTVFVFDDSSPYYEHVIIDKSIYLVGEEKNTTIIDGSGSGHVVTLAENGITLNGFTIQKGGPYGSFHSGVCIRSNHNTVNNNKILNSGNGIITEDASNNIISENIISGNGRGIMIREESNDNSITRNTIIGNTGGVDLQNIGSLNPSNNIVSWNNIKDNPLLGITTESQNKLVISHNNIENSDIGISLATSQLAKVKFNNFINLVTNASFVLCYGVHWWRNYWNKPMFLPKAIHGYNVIIVPPFRFPDDIKFINWYHFDWRPALKPYDITDYKVERRRYNAE